MVFSQGRHEQQSAAQRAEFLYDFAGDEDPFPFALAACGPLHTFQEIPGNGDSRYLEVDIFGITARNEGHDAQHDRNTRILEVFQGFGALRDLKNRLSDHEVGAFPDLSPRGIQLFFPVGTDSQPDPDQKAALFSEGIPQEILEAARVDGANGWQLLVSVQVPLVGSTISFLVITSIIGVIKIFDLVLVMGGQTGGPMGSARVIAFTQYVETFQNARVGYGSAVAVVMLLIILPFMLLNLRRFRAEESQH